MAAVSHRRPTAPEWLRHPLNVPRGPVPYGAVVRGALTTGPLLAVGVATQHVAWGVLAALGALFATVNDRPGTRRTRMVRIGVPACAGALGTLLGVLIAVLVPAGGVADAVWLVPVLAVAGYLSGAASAVGPITSAASLQFLVTLLIGVGLPHHGPVWLGPVLVAVGALWQLLVVCVTLPEPHAEEREAVASVYDALGAVLTAAGTGRGQVARRRLTAAFDTAHAALDHHRGIRRIGQVSAAERRLRAQLSVATTLGEAAVTLLWEGRPLPAATLDAPARLARAVREAAPCGPIATPHADTPGRRALHRALLSAAEAFDAPAWPVPGPRDRSALRRAFGPLGREYGLRVALCVGACAAVAEVLRPAQWYWLPVTAAFLAKPDLGPLFSRAVSRVLGTVLGVVVFTVLEAVLPGSAGAVAAAALGGALIPVAARHFAFQTAALTSIVLALAVVSGTHGASGTRLVDTVLACAIALIVGHLPRIGGRRETVHEHWAAALRAAEAYFAHVVGAPGEEHDERARLRRAAYRALAEARRTVVQAAAELPPAGVASAQWAPALAAVERLVDATTACAVRLEHGRRPLPADDTRRLADALARLAADASARRPTRRVALPTAAELGTRCASLADVAEQLHVLRNVSVAA
ncbi:FUSC family protein [Streptomyces sp. RPT161]|uniref:FUSC family protein n=1 Tax=Streptomyces sp. RPT161 TaxID=3015993 RepID=UPI0022B8FEF1|nr:FUSC family protein [Streptomyces sp. RPT161]